MVNLINFFLDLPSLFSHLFELLLNKESVICLQDLLVNKMTPGVSGQLIVKEAFVEMGWGRMAEVVEHSLLILHEFVDTGAQLANLRDPLLLDEPVAEAGLGSVRIKLDAVLSLSELNFFVVSFNLLKIALSINQRFRRMFRLTVRLVVGLLKEGVELVVFRDAVV